MTFSTDPPLISDLSLIPGTDEKADLNAPAGSGGKLVIGQAPNITITETSVVADAAERLQLDVQEGDVAIQTNVSTSFIFTGGDNVAPNWQALDFDAVGAIAGEDIAPGDVNASGDMSMQDLTVAGAINGADTSAAAAGEALTSDGGGGFSFASVGGDALTQMSDFLTQANMSQIAASQSDMQDVVNTGLIQNVAASQTAIQEVAASQTAMQEVAASQLAIQEVIASPFALNEVVNSQTAMQEIAVSQTAMQTVATSETAMQEVAVSQTAMQEVAATQTAMREIGLSQTAQTEILNSNTAKTVLNNQSTSFSRSGSANVRSDLRDVIPETDENYAVYIKNANYTGFSGFGTGAAGWFDANDNYLGNSFGEIFVDTLSIGWNTAENRDSTQNYSGNGEALIF